MNSRAIRLSYFRRIDNIGDLLSPQVVSEISRVPTRWFSGGDRPHLLAIGSILSGANAHSTVWGSGLMFPERIPDQLNPLQVHALRGKLSHAALKAAGKTLPDMPLGDPGWLLPASILRQPAEPKRFRFGFIPHHVDRVHPLFQRLVRELDVADLNVHGDIDDFFQTLRQCEAVVSSSLHGLIFAEALNIPNLWIGLSERVLKTEFKFRDWFSLAADPQKTPYLPSGAETVGELSARASTHGMQINSAELAGSFPTDKIDALSDPISQRTFVSLADSRRRALPIFVICRNSAGALERNIAACERFDGACEIIIHDQASDDVETCALLQRLEHKGYKVFRGPHPHGDAFMPPVETIQAYFETWSEPSRYVLTDCEADLSSLPADALHVFDAILNRHTWVACAGPALVADAADAEIQLLAGRDVASAERPLDASFALYRPGADFQIFKSARRTFRPYAIENEAPLTELGP